MAMLAIEFLLCLSVIVGAGIYLSRLADDLAEATGLGRTWIGSILLAGVTSLPETFNCIGALTLAKTPDLAVGNLMGSSVFNLALFAALGAIYSRAPIYAAAAPEHAFTASCGGILIGLASLGTVLGHLDLSPSWGHIGPYTLAAFALYIVFARMMAGESHGPAERIEAFGETSEPDRSGQILAAGVKFAAAALVIVAAALRMPFLGARLSEAMNWNQTFVGSLFIAFTTCLPELVVTVAAARQGALDLAIGNLLGSNLFNMGLLGVLDLIYLDAPLLANVSAANAATGLTGILMTCVILAALTGPRANRSPGAQRWIGAALVFLFAANAAIISQAAK